MDTEKSGVCQACTHEHKSADGSCGCGCGAGKRQDDKKICQSCGQAHKDGGTCG